jgi:hypothetical protein
MGGEPSKIIFFSVNGVIPIIPGVNGGGDEVVGSAVIPAAKVPAREELAPSERFSSLGRERFCPAVLSKHTGKGSVFPSPNERP